MSRWTAQARLVIREVLKANPDDPPESLKRKLRDAYPFGPRLYHPYRTWLREVRRVTGGRTRRNPSSDCPGQMSLELD